MSRRSPARFRAPVPTLALLVAACSTGGDATADAAAGGPASEATPAAGADLRLADLRAMMELAGEKLVSLAQAMPASTHDWRPMEGVRSVSDVFKHVAADNWFVPALMGIEAPAETGVTADPSTFQAYQTRDMTAEEMVAALEASFAFFLEAMDGSADELDREVVLGTPTTVGDVWIRAVVHVHEHLGQSIAYARANEVVPPWSR